MKQEKDSKLSSAFANRKATEDKKSQDSDSPAVDTAPFINRFGQDKIDAWKKQFGDRKLIALGCEGKFAALRPPTAEDLGEYMTAIATNGMSKAVTMIMETLWLDGDYELIENEDYFIAVFLQVNNVLEGKKADFFRL